VVVRDLRSLGPPVRVLAEAWHFTLGLRGLLRQPPTLEEARSRVASALRQREQVFLDSLERLVWSQPNSPYHPLLAHAGVEQGDLEALVLELGLSTALAQLRNEGVYVSHEEWLGHEPARRGSTTLSFNPVDFRNPRARADLFLGTGGSRTAGVPVAWSYRHLRRGVDRYLLRASTWGVMDAPAAVWLPVLPSGAGVATVLLLAGAGVVPERWFTPVPGNLEGLFTRRRAANALLPVLGRTLGTSLPKPEVVPAGDAAPVLSWVLDALRRHGRARLGAYTSSVVRLAELACESGTRLDGLVVAVLGEPLGASRARAIRASGALPAAGYGFMQRGTVAHACPWCSDEELHVLEDAVEVITRPRRRPDGVEVDAFLWTSLDQDTPNVLINVENDDYGVLSRDTEPCICELGTLGVRTRLSHVRGISKVSTQGMSVSGELLERLVSVVLPAKFGGAPTDFQFVEEGLPDGGRLALRIDPNVGDVDGEAVLEAVGTELRRTASGLVAAELWSSTRAVRVVRAAPRATASGKILPLQTLGRETVV
jgi:hypothetical protein